MERLCLVRLDVPLVLDVSESKRVPADDAAAALADWLAAVAGLDSSQTAMLTRELAFVGVETTVGGPV